MGKQYFYMYVRDGDNNIIGEGLGTSKQKGEKKAAKNAYMMLKKKFPDIVNESLETEYKDVIISPNDTIINK